jgi:2-octaprenylphenol hydroxylase
MSQQFDVLIIGGGIVGLTAALAMSQRNYTVAVIDVGALKVDISAGALRVYAINKASQNLLYQLNVWQRLDTNRVSPYTKMYVWDGINGAHIDFDSRYIAAQNLGAIIEESVVKQALLQQIFDESTISLFPCCSIDEVKILEHGVRIGGQNIILEGQLLMIADGANSPTRQKLNITLTSWSYNQQALVATVATEKPHQQTAYQVFNPDGPLAFLPLYHPNQCSIVWSTNPLRAQNLMDFDAEQFDLELTHAFAEQLGKVHLVNARHQFPLQMRHVKQYTGNHWMLLGDAAHTIHPLAGLGLNVGLADVSTWLHYLDASDGILVSKKLLGAYQRERKYTVWQTILLMEGFKHLFGYSHAPIATLRGLGLRICNEITPLKRLFIEHAAG